MTHDVKLMYEMDMYLNNIYIYIYIYIYLDFKFVIIFL